MGTGTAKRILGKSALGNFLARTFFRHFDYLNGIRAIVIAISKWIR